VVITMAVLHRSGPGWSGFTSCPSLRDRLYSDPVSHRSTRATCTTRPSTRSGRTRGQERWIFLPAGRAIDASTRPLGLPGRTKVWKEFAFGRRVETRYMEKVSTEKWSVATYVWKDDETDALRAPDEGIRNHAEIARASAHDIPGVADCASCHEGRKVQVLGFSALQLSRDRDPGAPHAEAVTPDMVDLTTLVERKLIASYPRGWATHPPRIAASSPMERAALGYLHANCGSCHDRSTPWPRSGCCCASRPRPPTRKGPSARRRSTRRARSSFRATRREGPTGSSRGTRHEAPSSSAWRRAIPCGRCRRWAPRSSTRRAST